jgi:hypothetical protein
MTDEPRRRGRPPREATAIADYVIRVRVIRDFWVGEDRTVAGTVLDMDVMDAIDGIESGALARVRD